MHFNILLSGFRLKAIGGIALGAIAGVGLKVSNTALSSPLTEFLVFFSLTVIWFLVWAVDYFYYYRLLAGAIDELLRLERQLKDIHLSHLIERRVMGFGPPEDDIEAIFPVKPSYSPKFPCGAILCFYLLPALMLVGVSTWTGVVAFCCNH